jgi:two-component system alkaline phosphatase synthesis response regulator PhoP
VKVAKKEFALLVILSSQPDRVFTKDELLTAVWGSNVARGRTLESHVSKLRSTLRRAGAEGMIINCWGIGYRLRDRGDLVSLPALTPAGEAA